MIITTLILAIGLMCSPTYAGEPESNVADRVAIGVDLGTEFVRSVAFNGAAPRNFEVVEDSDGDQRLSTAVGSNGGERLVGADALHFGKKKPEKVRIDVRSRRWNP